MWDDFCFKFIIIIICMELQFLLTPCVREYLIKLMIFVVVHAEYVVSAGSIDGCAVLCH